MKNISLSLIAFIFIACSESQEVKDNRAIGELFKTSTNVNGYYLSIIEYDSCEYIVSGTYYAQMITHKGNCKYCTKRNKIK